MDTNNVTVITKKTPHSERYSTVLDRAEARLASVFSFDVVARCLGPCSMCDAGDMAHAA
ncbi:MAG: hypothetical protein IIC71_13000 [Acidobacteria bacterium]|nr:hypothetical protein [Acidobacteriota bacterium]